MPRARFTFDAEFDFDFGPETYWAQMLLDEVEIANITYASVMWDVIQVRARPEGNRIAYRVADEYEAEGSRYKIKPEWSSNPLSFGELIELIDGADCDSSYGAGLVEPILVANLEGCSPDELNGFVSVTSAFYPEISRYYGAREEVCLAAALPADDVED